MRCNSVEMLEKKIINRYVKGKCRDIKIPKVERTERKLMKIVKGSKC